MEVKLWYFNNKKGIGGHVEARLIKKTCIYKGGLIVNEIELRPIEIE